MHKYHAFETYKYQKDSVTIRALIQVVYAVVTRTNLWNNMFVIGIFSKISIKTSDLWISIRSKACKILTSIVFHLKVVLRNKSSTKLSTTID